MRTVRFRFSYLLLGVALFSLASLPQKSSNRMRSIAIAAVAPIAKPAIAWRRSLSSEERELKRLQLENTELRAELELIKEESTRQPCAVPAQVIYRDPSSWSSSLWVDVGEEKNRLLGRRAIEKNSPVTSGNALVGVIDYVGRRHSRVRLITDSGISPAVRVLRGVPQDRFLALQMEPLHTLLQVRRDLFASEEEKKNFLLAFETLKSRLDKRREELYLAKGELQGSSAPLWRARRPLLRGIGFNYDYADEEGPARELRTGRPLSSKVSSQRRIPILQEGDLLVTSGLDGVFPKGLAVATVTSIDPLKEGAYAYELKAQPACSHLNDLQQLFVLPALNEE